MKARKRLLTYLALGKKYLWLIILAVFVAVLSEIAQPFLLGRALDAILNDSNLIAFIIYLIVALVLAMLGVLISYLFEYLVAQYSQEIVYKLRMDIYKKLNDVSVDTLYKDQAGNLVQYEINDIENISNGISAVFKSLFRGILAVAITIVMMFLVNYLLAIIVIILTPLSVLVSRFIANSNQKYFKAQASLQARLNETSLETIEGSEIIQSFNNEKNSYEKFFKENEELRRKGIVAQFAASWINPSTRLVNNTIYVIVGIFGIILISVTKMADFAQAILAMMTLGKLSSFLSYTTQYTKPFNDISSVVSEYEIAKTSFERINDFLNKENDIDEGVKTIDTIKNIEFKDMSFSYDSDKPLIENLNLKIKQGEKVAIVGPTGAGKTTLINVLLRYYDPQSGDILFNDVSFKDVKKSELRKHFGLVLQDTWIFNGTILDNIKYAKPDATDEEIINVCKRLNIHELIETQPFSYKTVISSKDGLSEGEKQIISLARVMLANPEIVILDEATSNIDTHTEKLINNAFDEIVKNSTSIVIAHRLSTIKNADVILVLKDGKIVEQGKHDELLKRNGLYHSMYSSQFK